REQTMLHQPQDVVGAIAEIHDVPDVFDIDIVTKLVAEPLADAFERAAKAGAGGTVTAHAYVNWSVHRRCSRQDDRPLAPTATPDAASPIPRATRMPATPVAEASSPASAGKTIWPTRLPVMRSVSAVPQASAGARCTTPEMVKVEAMPMAKPSTMSTAYIIG